MLDIKTLLLDAVSEKMDIPNLATMKAVNDYCEEVIMSMDAAHESHLAPFLDKPKEEIE
jgi:hypothetical protein